MKVRDVRVRMLLTHATTASLLGCRACVEAEYGNEEMAYHAARMAWRWATWAAEDADRLSASLEATR